MDSTTGFDVVSKSDLLVSFWVAFAFWLMGRLAGYWWGVSYGLVDLTQAGVLEAVLLGLGAVFFGSVFFGRTVFVSFFLLGLLVSPVLSLQGVLVNVLLGFGLAWLGMIGASVGKRTAQALSEDGTVQIVSRSLLIAGLIGFLVLGGIGAQMTWIQETNGHMIGVLRAFRNGEIDFVTAVARLAGAAYIPSDSAPS